MNIEIIASFSFPNGEIPDLDDAKSGFRVSYWPNQSSVSLELINTKEHLGLLDAIMDFFFVFDRCGGGVLGRAGSLRVAAYFSPDEVAAFSVFLSREVVSMLFDRCLDIEVTGFPCSD